MKLASPSIGNYVISTQKVQCFSKKIRRIFKCVPGARFWPCQSGSDGFGENRRFLIDGPWSRRKMSIRERRIWRKLSLSHWRSLV